MKKNRMMRLASVLLIMTLLSTSVISGTFAKYVSSATGSDTARVAKWHIEVEDNKLGVENATITFDLFKTINDTGNTAAESDVKTGEIIAPGTAGSFELNIKNLSEVNAKYSVALTESNDNAVPLQYSVDGNTWNDSIAELTMTELTDKAIAMETGTASHTVYWRWVFEGTTEGAHAGQTDAYDTALGVYARENTGYPVVTIQATITVTQID